MKCLTTSYRLASVGTASSVPIHSPASPVPPKKRVVLYNPSAVFHDMPLALVAIGSALDRDRFEVVIVDARVDDDAHRRVLDLAQGALCLGVTALTGRPLRDALALTRKVKSAHPTLPVVWGGWHPSLFAKEVLHGEPTVDVTVQAQGEETFCELIERLASGQDLGGLLGATFRDKSGEVIQNAARPLVNFNALPRADYNLIDPERYFKAKGRRQFDYISSTGCHFRCAFCADPEVFGRAWTAIDPLRMGDELEFWYRRFGFSDINFQDETFFTQPRRVAAFAEELLRREIKTTWAGTMRADQGFRMTDEDFDLVKRSGLRRVLVGVESGSQEMMDWLRKDIKIDQVFRVAEQCRRIGIEVIFPFIVGFPGESDKSFRATLDMARKLRAMAPGFATPIFYFKPYPGSTITQDAVAQGYTLPDSLEAWSDFDYVAGSSGPWVTPERFQLVERFKFYNKAAHYPGAWYMQPFGWLARQRMNLDYFSFPFEKAIAEWVLPRQQLS